MIRLDIIFLTLSTVLVLSFLVVPLYLLIKDVEEREEKAALISKMFPTGSFVTFRMDGRKGIVTGNNSRCVWVRALSKTERTNTSLFGSDGNIEISPYSHDCYRPFEIHN